MSSKLLLDTHALVQFVSDEIEIPTLARLLQQRLQSGSLYVSSVAFWEVAFLVQKKRLALNDVARWTEQVVSLSGIQLLQPTVQDMVASTLLPPHHKDPFDRLIIAQAKAAGLVIVTRDELFAEYRAKTVWR